MILQRFIQSTEYIVYLNLTGIDCVESKLVFLLLFFLISNFYTYLLSLSTWWYIESYQLTSNNYFLGEIERLTDRWTDREQRDRERENNIGNFFFYKLHVFVSP